MDVLPTKCFVPCGQCTLLCIQVSMLISLLLFSFIFIRCETLDIDRMRTQHKSKTDWIFAAAPCVFRCFWLFLVVACCFMLPSSYRRHYNIYLNYVQNIYISIYNTCKHLSTQIDLASKRVFCSNANCLLYTYVLHI